MDAAAKRSIHSLHLQEIEAYLASQNERPFRAKQIVDWLYEKRVNAFEEMTDLPQVLGQRTSTSRNQDQRVNELEQFGFVSQKFICRVCAQSEGWQARGRTQDGQPGRA